MTYQDVLDFWFEESQPAQWFEKNEAYDATIRRRFLTTHQQATKGELASWRSTIQGRLAEIIVLDQFSRNLFREDHRSFQSDGMALVLAQEALATGKTAELTVDQRTFLWMPFMHSESLAIHDQALELFAEEGMETFLSYEIKHRKIIERFGHYPHRNEVLGRQTTKEEAAFLLEPDSSF